MGPPVGLSDGALPAELAPLAARIERLVLAPAEVRDTVGWLARPLLRAIGWSPTYSTAALRALLAAIGEAREHELERHVERALEELEGNVGIAERAVVVHGRPPMGHATWLFRALETLARVLRARSAPREAQRAVAHGDPVLLLGPPDEQGAGALVRVDLVLELARQEGELLGRRRALLETARALLLDATAALALPHDAVAARIAYVASSIEEIDRLQAAGVDPRRGLLHQARAAVHRGERERLRACLVAVDAVARRRGDVRLATLSARALEACGGDPLAREGARASVARSAEQSFGIPVIERVREGIVHGREAATRARESASEKQKAMLARVETYLGHDAEAELLSAALAVDGWFDVGGASTPVRIVEEERRRELVRHPAAELVLVPAQRVEELRDAVLTDPRAILFQLAEGTLLARRFVDEEVRRHTRSRLTTELRIYVADGSSSMLGPRARMRDAILLAELATLIGRLRQPGRYLSPVLELRFFDRQLGPIERVSTVDGALAAIARIFETPRLGGTSIQRALLGSFEQVRERRASDPTLASAQIVLVTDGVAPIDVAALRAAREAAGEVPVRLSVIALGLENPALRALAAEQRARGEQVFYHFVPDAELARIVAGDLERRLVLHVPDVATAGVDAPADALRGLVEEMEALARREHDARRRSFEGTSALDAERAAELRAAAAELALSVDDLFVEGARARFELIERDERAVGMLFSRWFPERVGSSAPEPLPHTPARERVDLARILLASTVEVVAHVGGRPIERQAEAIVLFERLLFEHGLPPWTYAQIVREHGGLLEAELRTVHAVVRR